MMSAYVFLRDAKTQQTGFQILVGGGLGRTPMEGKVLCEFLPREKLLAYLEAILRVYNLEGRRDNKYKARIKILTHEIGIEALRAKVDEEFAQLDGTNFAADLEEFSRIAAHFAPLAYDNLPDVSRQLEAAQAKDEELARFRRTQSLSSQAQGLCGSDHFAESARRDAGRCERGAAARHR